MSCAPTGKAGRWGLALLALLAVAASAQSSLDFSRDVAMRAQEEQELLDIEKSIEGDDYPAELMTKLPSPPSSSESSLPRFRQTPSPSSTPNEITIYNATGANFTYRYAADSLQPSCDLTAERGICIYGGQKVIVPDAAPKMLVGYWTFDDTLCLDSSRHQNHGSSVVPAGPGRGGRGHSARFSGDNWAEFPSNPSFNNIELEFTVSFWINLLPNYNPPLSANCSIAYMGSYEDSVFDIAFDPKTNQLAAFAIKNQLVVTSNARLSRSRWHHIALVLDSNYLVLYVNGVLDSFTLAGNATASFSRRQLFAGRVPWNKQECVVSSYFDDLRLMTRALSTVEVQAESFPALGSVEPGYIKLACGGDGCTYDQAVANCGSDYHLCHENELYAGALQAARAMGYIPSFKSPVWKNDVFDPSQAHQGVKSDVKIGVCCANA